METTKYKIFSTSLQGERDTNEDSHIIYENDKLKIYAIFDGHGGNEVSLLLKKQMVNILTNKDIKYPLNPHQITRIFKNLQDYIKKQKYANKAGSTACIVILYTNEQNQLRMYCINVGDSRCLLYTNNKLYQMSDDHKPTNIKEIERISNMGGNIRRDGLDYRIGDLSVSRTFGDCNNKYTDPIPEITSKLLTDDFFIVLGCDGLFDTLTNNDISFEVNDYIKKNKKYNIALLLAKQAIKNGSTDNVSVIVVISNTENTNTNKKGIKNK